MPKDNNEFQHFWIPEGEIEVLENNPTGRRKP
jgi:hypothetical protein